MSLEMRLPLFALCALLCANAWAVETCELNGERLSLASGHTTAGKTGVMRCTDDRGTLRKEENLENGNAVGVQKTFAEAGHLEELNFALGRRTVLTIAFLADGRLTGLRCAPVTLVPQDREVCGHSGRASDVTLYRKAGTPAGTVRYLHGQMQRQTVIDGEGRMVRSEEIKDGRRIKRVFYPSGQVRSEADFIERDPNSREGREGVSRERAESGQLTQEITWADGHEQSIQQWYLNGKQKIRQQIRRDGRNQERTTESFWDSGLPAAVNVERNGRLLGWQRYFTTAGVLAVEDEHGERGLLLRRKHFDAQGVFVREERFLEDGSRI